MPLEQPLTTDEIAQLDASYPSWRDSFSATLTQAQIAFLRWLVQYIKAH